jgi:hypothetical protein
MARRFFVGFVAGAITAVLYGGFPTLGVVLALGVLFVSFQRASQSSMAGALFGFGGTWALLTAITAIGCVAPNAVCGQTPIIPSALLSLGAILAGLAVAATASRHPPVAGQ